MVYYRKLIHQLNKSNQNQQFVAFKSCEIITIERSSINIYGETSSKVGKYRTGLILQHNSDVFDEKVAGDRCWFEG